MTITFVALAIALAVAVLTVPVAFMVTLPTTSACRSVIDASAEPRLVYPGSQRLSYQSHEGTRQLIEMSSPQLPGFIAHLAIPSIDRGVFPWFDEQLRALGWRPVNPEARLQVAQSSGDTTRGGAEEISLVRLDAGHVPPGVTARLPEGQDLLIYAYFIRDPTHVSGCR